MCNLFFISDLYFIVEYSVLAVSYFSLVAKLLEKATRVHVKSAVESTLRIAFPKEVAILFEYRRKQLGRRINLAITW